MGSHQYAGAAGMSCVMNVYVEAVGSNLGHASAPGIRTHFQSTFPRLRRTPHASLRRVSARTLDTTTIISNKEAEA